MIRISTSLQITCKLRSTGTFQVPSVLQVSPCGKQEHVTSTCFASCAASASVWTARLSLPAPPLRSHCSSKRITKAHLRLRQFAASKMQLRNGDPSPVSPSMLFRFAARASRLVRRLLGDTGVSGEPKPSRAQPSVPRLGLGGLVAAGSFDGRAVDRTSPWMRRAARDVLSCARRRACAIRFAARSTSPALTSCAPAVAGSMDSQRARSCAHRLAWSKSAPWMAHTVLLNDSL